MSDADAGKPRDRFLDSSADRIAAVRAALELLGGLPDVYLEDVVLLAEYLRTGRREQPGDKR